MDQRVYHGRQVWFFLSDAVRALLVETVPLKKSFKCQKRNEIQMENGRRRVTCLKFVIPQRMSLL